MRNGYEYPKILYCGDCEKRVPVKLETRQDILVRELNHHTEEISVSYQAALCPLCGKVLCENDRDWALIRLTQEQRK